jgi:hypothetical protein
MMNALRPILCLFTILVATAGPALATPVSTTSQMGVGTWLFIGFCALIFVAQLTPALLLLFGMVKGVFEGKKKASSPHRLT